MENMRAAQVATGSDVPDGASDEEFKPMTAEEAGQWRKRHPPVSFGLVIALQVAVALVFALVVAGLFGWAAGISAAYGALAVIVPALVLVRALRVRLLLKDSGVAFLNFVVWEVVKVVLTVVMLLLAPKLVPALNWLALVAGFVVTMKAYWVAAWLQSKRNLPAVNF